MSTKKVKNTRVETKKKADLSIEILGVAISGTQLSQVLRRVALQRKNLLHIATVNPEFVMEARNNPKFSQVLEETDLKVADGWGIVLAAKLLYDREIDRITGGELVNHILQRANERKEKVFLLGASDGVAERAMEKMKAEYPDVDYAWYEGARSVQVEKSEEASMTIAKINTFEPDYLLVAYGSPWQDTWIEENREYLRAKVAIGIGGLLDEWAGVIAECPEIVDRMRLKWLWRLVHQPWRWRRVARVVKFAVLVMYHKIID